MSKEIFLENPQGLYDHYTGEIMSSASGTEYDSASVTVSFLSLGGLLDFGFRISFQSVGNVAIAISLQFVIINV